MARKDFPSEVESPGLRVDGGHFRVLCRRFEFARRFTRGKRVLDVSCGCGLGLGCVAREAQSIIAADITDASLRQARATYRERHRVCFLRHDAHALPFAGASFQVVLALGTVFYLNMDTFLPECRRVLTPDGVLVFCTPNKDSRGFRPRPFATSYASVPELAETFDRHGFEIDVWGAFPAPEARVDLTRQLIHTASRLFERCRLPRSFKNSLKDVACHVLKREVHYLPEELTESDLTMVSGIPLEALPTSVPNTRYSTLYGAARPHWHATAGLQ